TKVTECEPPSRRADPLIYFLLAMLSRSARTMRAIAADREVPTASRSRLPAPILVRMRDRLTIPLGWSDSIGYPLALQIAYLDSIPLDLDCRLWSSASISRETMSGIAMVAFQPRTRWALAGFPALI